MAGYSNMFGATPTTTTKSYNQNPLAGLGSTGGGVTGGVVGGAIGGPTGAAIGAAGGSLVGGALDKGGSVRTQTPTQMGSYDPYANFTARPAIESAVLGGLAQPHTVNAPGPVPDLYAEPSGQQTGALGQIQGFSEQATPAFGAGLGQQMGTIGGQYLDPSQVPAFRNLSNSRINIARMLFNEFEPESRDAAAARGNPYGSSSQAAEVQRGGERLANEAARDISLAGWGQYGAERPLQEAAARGGEALGPGLAGQVFSGAETLRGAQQGANIAQAQQETQRQIAAMEGQLRAQGYDDAAIRTALQYMSLSGTTPVSPVLGATPEQQATARANSAAAIAKGIGQITPPPKAAPGVPGAPYRVGGPDIPPPDSVVPPDVLPGGVGAQPY